MIVCVCHGLNDKAITEARQHGASKAGQVYRYHGVKPECGQCVSKIRNVLSGGAVEESGSCTACPRRAVG